ncbi:MAG: hypothetical protein Salg2KO_10530 [Salibacteraceae bacterium]
MLTSVLCIAAISISAQNMSINSNGADPDNSAMLDVQSTSQGLLIPRMTEAQRLSIVNPAYGLMVVQSDNSEGIYIYDTAAAGIWRYVIDSIGVANMIASQAGGDTLGNHEMTQNLNTNGHFISNDGDSEGLSVAGNGALTATPATTGPGNVALFTNGDLRTVGQGTGYYLTNSQIGITGNNGNSGDMRLLTGSNTRIAISSAGNVTINTPASGNALNVNGIADVDSLRVNNSYGLPTIDGSAGQVLETDGAGNVTWENASGGGNGIYGGSGSLSSNTVVTGGANTIDFNTTATDGFSVDGTTFSVDGANNRVGIGTNSPTETLSVVGTVSMSITNVNLAGGTLNDLNLGATANVVRLTGSTSSISGIVAASDGRVIHIINRTGGDVDFLHNNAGSAASNRILGYNLNDMTLKPNGGINLIYSSTDSRWLVIANKF